MHLVRHIITSFIQFADALVRLVKQDLRHALYGNGKGDHRVLVTATIAVAVLFARAYRAEDAVTRLAEKQLLTGVVGTLWDYFPPLTGHEVQQLVNQKAGRQCTDATPWQGDGLPTYGTAEGSSVSRLTAGDSLQTLAADRVRAGQQFWSVILTIVRTCNIKIYLYMLVH